MFAHVNGKLKIWATYIEYKESIHTLIPFETVDVWWFFNDRHAFTMFSPRCTQRPEYHELYFNSYK
ncbi:hypothetical protein WN48_10263 [Eufriesea mexicana]|uniref:Uncharacterized protein n=1 Tax=Eufriesea mexicana TaxID=516756 RepID=A0A310SGJ9_9HYME|nr:hypothetical protein WN48_10263 [Eufriesea mexicana]